MMCGTLGKCLGCCSGCGNNGEGLGKEMGFSEVPMC